MTCAESIGGLGRLYREYSVNDVAFEMPWLQNFLGRSSVSNQAYDGPGVISEPGVDPT